MKNAHLITCRGKEEFEKFVTQGFVGVYPKGVDTEKELNVFTFGSKIGTNWDIVSDLKRVKPGDLCFIHVNFESKVYGPFLCITSFMEYSKMPDCFLSKNLNIEFWSKNYVHPVFADYPWKAGIESIEGVTKLDGFNAMDLFKLKSVGAIQSIPDRFNYHDKPKVVKPLLAHEVQIIISALKQIGCKDFHSIPKYNFEDYNDITLSLVSYKGQVFREKILEAWLMENYTFNGNNELAFQNVMSIFGSRTHFLNSIFTYYTNFMDVMIYDYELPSNEINNKANGNDLRLGVNNIGIIELKKGKCDNDSIDQLREYGDWARIAFKNKFEDIDMYLVGSSFKKDLKCPGNMQFIRYRLVKESPYLILERIA